MVRLTWAPAAAGMVALLVLAGCSGKAATQDTATTGFLDGKPTSADKGAISGVVVDEAIRPIAGANVTLGSTGIKARTDTSGRFLFSDVAPGFTTLFASAKGYFAIQASADVVAGETAKVRILLATDKTPQPYHQTMKFKGFIQFWGGIAQFFVEDVYTAFVDPKGSALCDCNYYFTPDANLTGLVFEATWTDTVPHPTGAEDKEFYALVTQSHSNMFESKYCTSPCRYVVSLKDFKPGVTKAVLQGPDLYVSVNQEYVMLVTTFYGAPPPADWSFVKGSP